VFEHRDDHLADERFVVVRATSVEIDNCGRIGGPAM